jgi:hypothetical protein
VSFTKVTEVGLSNKFTGRKISMSDASGTTSLSVDDVLELITVAKAATADPISTSLAIFQGLGENAVLSGDVLRQSLSQASFAPEGSLADVLTAVGSITKTGTLITLLNNHELRPVVQGNTIRLKETVTFQVGLDGGNPSLSNIEGVAVHKVFWIDIQQVQVRHQDGQKMVHVVTGHGTRDFPLS